MKRALRSVIALGGASAIAALPAISAAQAPPPPSVTVAKPLAKRVTTWDEYSGHFEAVETVEVRPRVSGFIDKVHFKDGQIVKAGEALFTIDQSPFDLAVQSARADVERTKAQVAFQATEVERAAPLVKSGAVTERDFTQRSANLSVAQAQQQAAEAALKSAQLNFEWSIVRSPIDGRISDRKVDLGNIVTASETVLTTIVSLDPIHFVFDASESDYLRYTRLYKSGARPSSRDVPNPVRVKLADEETFRHEGTMDFVDNRMNPRSGTLRARAVLENKDHFLVPGIFGRLQLFGGDVDALLLPDSAIVSDQTRKIVLTLGEDGAVKAAPVTLGPITEGLRVIQSGLTPEDEVIIDGLANPMVRPGAKVTPEPGEIKPPATN